MSPPSSTFSSSSACLLGKPGAGRAGDAQEVKKSTLASKIGVDDGQREGGREGGGGQVRRQSRVLLHYRVTIFDVFTLLLIS